MSIENKTKNPSIIKSILISTVALAVIIGVAVLGFPLLKLPGWPFTFFLFYFVSIERMSKDKLLTTAIGGFIGITVGFSPELLTVLTGSEGIAWLGFLVLLIALVTMVVDGRVKVINHLCMLMVTVLLPPGLELNLPPEAYLPAVCSYVIAVAIFAIMVNVIPKQSKEEPSCESGKERI